MVILVRVIDGALRKGQQVKFMAAGTTHLVDRVGCFTPKIEQLAELGARTLEEYPIDQAGVVQIRSPSAPGRRGSTPTVSHAKGKDWL